MTLPFLSSPLLQQPLFLALLAASVTALGLTAALLFGFPLFLPFLLLAGLLGLFLTFRSPFALLIFLLVIRMSLDYSAQYFSFTLYDASFTLSQIMGVGIGALGILIIVLHRSKIRAFPLNAPFWLVLAWGVMTLTYSLRPEDTLQELLRFFDLYVLSFLAFTAIETTTDFKKLLWAVFASGVLPVVAAFYQFAFGIGLVDENVGIPRIFGTFSHPNVLSLYLMALVALSVLYFFVYAKERKSRILVFMVSLIFATVLFLTFARVAWVALFFFLFLVGLFRYRLLLVPLVLLPLVFFVFSSAFQARVLESFHADPDSSLLWRQTLWQDVISKTTLDGRQYLGSGMNTATLVSESIRGTALGPNETHNDFIKFFIEGGYVGVIVFGTYLLSIFFLLFRQYQNNRANPAQRSAWTIMIFFFLSLILASLTDNVFKNTPVQWIFFIVLGGLLALSKKDQK